MASDNPLRITAPATPPAGAVPHRAHVSLRALAVLSLLGVFAPTPAPLHAAPAKPAPAAPTVQQVQGLLDAARYPQAEAAARALLAEVERLHGPNSVEAADVLDLLATAMRWEGRGSDPEARAICERALRIKETVLGPDDPRTAASLSSLGLLLYDLNQTDEARRLLARALGIRERALGSTHPDVARSLMLLAVAESQAGNDSTAMPLLERAIRIQEATLPPDAPELAQSLNVLATILSDQGDYARAGPLYEQALEKFSKHFGPDHPSVAQCEHNLGAVYSELGDAESSRRYFERALRARRRTLGPDHPLLASTLGDLGAVLEDLGDLAGARKRLEDALRIHLRAHGPENPAVAWTLMRLGRLDLGAGRYARARARLEQALGIQERVLGEQRPELSWTLTALAAVEEAEHDNSRARRSYERAIGVLDRAYGSAHPDRILVLNDYAGFLARAGDSTQALDTALRSAAARSDQLRSVTRGLGERQALRYVPVGGAGLDLAIRLAARGVGGAGGVERVWDAAIRSKMLVLDEMAFRQRTAAAAGADSGITALLRRVDEARHRYAALLVRSAGEEKVERPRAALDRVRERMEHAERDLAAGCQSFRLEEARARIGLEDVMAALPPGAALVSFALCDRGRAEAYVAFVAPPGAAPCVVSLGSARAVDDLVERWAGQVRLAPALDRGAAAARAEASCRRVGEALRRKVWDPIAARVGSASRVFVVPDGSLCRVNLAALPAERGQYLADLDPLLHLLTSERDLVPPTVDVRMGRGILALGGPAFDRPGTRLVTDPAEASLRSDQARGSTGNERGALPECPDFRSVRFHPLPGSIREAEEVARLWPDPASALVLTGARASQSAVESLAPGRRVIHLATHGFFLEGTACATDSSRRGIGAISSPGEAPRAATPPAGAAARPASPLRISGLALAGANRRNDAGSNDEDGILTAEEVASINLSGTEWAVLSACDTGVGHVQTGEGVLGLRRAFQIAGARTVIMSLWSVEDQATLRWMKALYEARFQRGLGTAEAVREASRTVLREQRAQGRSTHPFYWAGFVATGDWR